MFVVVAAVAVVISIFISVGVAGDGSVFFGGVVMDVVGVADVPGMSVVTIAVAVMFVVSSADVCQWPGSDPPIKISLGRPVSCARQGGLRPSHCQARPVQVRSYNGTYLGFLPWASVCAVLL